LRDLTLSNPASFQSKTPPNSEYVSSPSIYPFKSEGGQGTFPSTFNRFIEGAIFGIPNKSSSQGIILKLSYFSIDYRFFDRLALSLL
jgi:hypothetical protein